MPLSLAMDFSQRMRTLREQSYRPALRGAVQVQRPSKVALRILADNDLLADCGQHSA